MASSDLSLSEARLTAFISLQFQQQWKYFSLNDSSVHLILCIDENLILKLAIPALAFRRSRSFHEQVFFLFLFFLKLS